jgi:hypothetical protein
MATRNENTTVYAAGVVQGIVLVTFPAASTIFTDPYPTALFVGCAIGGGIMVLGGIVELIFGIKAEGKSLEDVTKLLTSASEGTTA